MVRYDEIVRPKLCATFNTSLPNCEWKLENMEDKIFVMCTKCDKFLQIFVETGMFISISKYVVKKYL